MYYCYLAGPMTSLSYKESIGWREHVAQALDSDNLKTLSPLRCKKFLEYEGTLHALGYSGNVMTTSRGVIARDRFDCTRCDVLFVNLLDAKQISIGTAMEMAWANLKQIPIVCIMEEGNIHEHAILSETIDFRVDIVDEGIEVVKAILA